jgi:hypothetical protein
VALFDASTGLLIKALAAPLRTHDMSQVAKLHPELTPGDIWWATAASVRTPIWPDLWREICTLCCGCISGFW